MGGQAAMGRRSPPAAAKSIYRSSLFRSLADVVTKICAVVRAKDGFGSSSGYRATCALSRVPRLSWVDVVGLCPRRVRGCGVALPKGVEPVSSSGRTAGWRWLGALRGAYGGRRSTQLTPWITCWRCRRAPIPANRPGTEVPGWAITTGILSTSESRGCGPRMEGPVSGPTSPARG